MIIFSFSLAIIFICLAHLIRAERWKLFIRIYEKPDEKVLVRSLSCGYLINFFVPFKLGDIVRAWISGRKMKNGKALGFSTVIVERFLDIVSVGLIFLFIYFFGKDYSNESGKSFFMYVILAAALMAVAALIYSCKRLVKKCVAGFAGIFNADIESSVLRFCWALIWNFKDIFAKINKLRLALYSIGMWALYLVSYFFFGQAVSTETQGVSWIDIFGSLFAGTGLSESTGNITMIWGNSISMYSVLMAVYMIVPNIVLLLLSFIFRASSAKGDEENYLNLLPHLDSSERLKFLESYFSDNDRTRVSNYLTINRKVSIIRDYSAGSNATTMLCTDGDKTFFRKYAFGDDGRKLAEQLQWITQYSDKLKLPEISESEVKDVYCYFDMPYVGRSVSFFEYVHSMPIEKSWSMVLRVLGSLEENLYSVVTGAADSETIGRYVEAKVTNNLKKIKSSKRINSLLGYDKLVVNGVEYNNLGYYEKYLTKEYLERIFIEDCYSPVHGDLTVENIICVLSESAEDDFYLIDPNTGNIHDSSNLDYGKLLQSIHGGYEFLLTTKGLNVSGNRIDFPFVKSQAYMELHKRLKEYMEEKFGKDRTRSIYFHEIVHWLRLMPYKIEKDGKRALLFYAGMIMIMNDIFDMYGEITDEK